MGEWVLILALNLASGTQGEIRDVTLTTLPGFTSKQSCETGAQTVAARTIAVVGQARIQSGIQGSGQKASPVLNYECVFVKK